MNPFDEYLDKLLDHINILNGFLDTLDNQLNNFRSLCNQYIKQDTLDELNLIFGTSVFMRDLTEWTTDGWAICYPSGKFMLQGREYLNMVDNLISRESSWTIAQAYESLETFLKDITASCLLLKKVDMNIIITNLSKFYPRKGLSPADFEYWREFTQRYYKSNDKILEFLRIIATDIEKAEEHNNRAINLKEWFEVVGEVRHAVTHSSALIKNDRISNWTEHKRLFLSDNFHGNYERNGYILNTKMSDSKECLTIYAEYAYTIYKSLSRQCNYDWYDVLLRKRSS